MAYVPDDSIVGVGTGSTVNYFIDELVRIKGRIEGAVSSSKASAERLRGLGIRVFDLNSVDEVPIYVDGADEITRHMQMIKGGGGALTGEKIVAAVARKFICIADASKLKDVLGAFPLPVEVIPMARSLVGRELVKLGGQPWLREGFVSDYGNIILDVHGLTILDPVELEADHQPDRRGRDQRPVRPAARGSAPARHGRRRANAVRLAPPGQDCNGSVKFGALNCR